jgi:hypothetical protein
MSLSPRIYDWPSLIRHRQFFHAGGQAFEGGFTSGGARVLSPEPGGRGILTIEFNFQVRDMKGNSIVSWVGTMIANGNIFRIPICWTPQLVSLADLGIAPSTGQGGMPWEAAGAMPAGPWANGQNWAYQVGAPSAAIALAGATVLVIDFANLPHALRHGHLIGHDDVTYLVEDIAYSGDEATITVNPPLRNAVAQGDFVSFRPTMLGTARNPDSFRGLYEPSSMIRLGSVEFVEALL